MHPTRLSLLVALPALAGCGAGLPALDADTGYDGVATGVMEQDVTLDVTVDTVFAGDLLADFPLTPTVEAFDVRPAALPLGGGPVLVSWEASDVANCALVVDSVPEAHGVGGELMIDVAEDTDLHLICLDHEQAMVAEARHEVTVVQPPVEGFQPDESVHVETWESASLLGRSGMAGEVHEVAVVLPDDGRLVVDVSATPERAQFELWLAADVDGDGFLASDEVLQVTRNSDTGRIDQVLPAGQYSLFVVTVTGAATWYLDLAVTDPTSDGNNF